jgi:hypothetical protein
LSKGNEKSKQEGVDERGILSKGNEKKKEEEQQNGKM